jgi:DNA-binding MarR family transcriptional regulator
MPTRGTAHQTGFLLQRAHRRLRAAHNEALRPLSLSIAHVAVAGLLADRGDLSQRQLIEIMDADKSTMVNLVDSLESQGLVERRRDPRDRRAHAVHLTEAGRRRLVTVGELVASIEDDFLGPLSMRERSRFNDLLRRVADGRAPLRRGAVGRRKSPRNVV